MISGGKTFRCRCSPGLCGVPEEVLKETVLDWAPASSLDGWLALSTVMRFMVADSYRVHSTKV